MKAFSVCRPTVMLPGELVPTAFYTSGGGGGIDVPERPIQILFGGPDRRMLFILGHHTLYAVFISS
jgi:hypothetical protein